MSDGATLGVSRTEAYTDGVFAIAATLLVLDLTSSAVGEVKTDAQMWAHLASLSDNFTSFGVSFALLSMLWIVHLRQFRDIVRVDQTLLWLNSARLLFIVLVPFTTSLTSEYSSFVAGRILMPINFFLAMLAGYLTWRWAIARDGHLMRDAEDPARTGENRDAIIAVVFSGIAMVLSPWFGSWSFLVFFLDRIVFLPFRKRRARKTD